MLRKVKEKDLPFPLLSPHAGGPPIRYSLIRQKDRRGKLFYDIVRIDPDCYGEFVCGFKRAAMAGWTLGELNRGGAHERDVLARFEGKRNHAEEEPKRSMPQRIGRGAETQAGNGSDEGNGREGGTD